MDTDSIKMDDNETSRGYIEKYNNKIKIMCEDAKKRTGATDLIDGLGEYDIEFGEGAKNGQITRLKILGAKRYILETDKGVKLQTVAGLPKGWLFDNIKDKDIFEVFTDKMVCEGCKLSTKYKDEEFTHLATDYLDNHYQVYEKSCVSLVPTDFSMKLDETWARLIFDEVLSDARQCKGRLL